MKGQNLSWITSPLHVIGLFVLLTEAILGGTAVIAAPESLQIPLICFMAAFPLFCGTAFFLVLWFRPQHFYSPSEYRQDESFLAAHGMEAFATIANASEDKHDDKTKTPSIEVLKAVVSNLYEPTCWYLLKVANRPLTVDEHVQALYAEGLADESPDFGLVEALRYFQGITHALLGLLFHATSDQSGDVDENTVTLQVSSEVIQLITQKLHPQLADDL